jgi:hypothetical protein
MIFSEDCSHGVTLVQKDSSNPQKGNWENEDGRGGEVGQADKIGDVNEPRQGCKGYSGKKKQHVNSYVFSLTASSRIEL